MPASAEANMLPDHPDLALFVATLFKRLGGRLVIDDEGRRLARLPSLRDERSGDGLPRLSGAQPWEQFDNADEWRGAIKLVRYWLDRLSDKDRDFVFTYCADLPMDISSRPVRER
jgi:hypothetical protein